MYGAINFIYFHARDPNSAGRQLLLIVLPVIPGVMTILFDGKKKAMYAYKNSTYFQIVN